MLRKSLARSVAYAALIAAATAAQAQTTTGIIRGSVSNAAAPAPGATVIATDINNGFTTRTTAGPERQLRPARPAVPEPTISRSMPAA